MNFAFLEIQANPMLAAVLQLDRYVLLNSLKMKKSNDVRKKSYAVEKY
jgi:hypothetical protein